MTPLSGARKFTPFLFCQVNNAIGFPCPCVTVHGLFVVLVVLVVVARCWGWIFSNSISKSSGSTGSVYEFIYQIIGAAQESTVTCHHVLLSSSLVVRISTYYPVLLHTTRHYKVLGSATIRKVPQNSKSYTKF